MLWVPAARLDVVYWAWPPEEFTVVPAPPSTLNVTVPVIPLWYPVWDAGDTGEMVAVNVTLSPTAAALVELAT